MCVQDVTQTFHPGPGKFAFPRFESRRHLSGGGALFLDCCHVRLCFFQKQVHHPFDIFVQGYLPGFVAPLIERVPALLQSQRVVCRTCNIHRSNESCKFPRSWCWGNLPIPSVCFELHKTRASTSFARFPSTVGIVTR